MPKKLDEIVAALGRKKGKRKIKNKWALGRWIYEKWKKARKR